MTGTPAFETLPTMQEGLWKFPYWIGMRALLALRDAAICTAGLAIAMTLAAMPATAQRVEVVLLERHDEPRGYCLDILGFKQKAQPERGLQTHSCYSYQGEVAVDQAFDRERIKAGVFYMPDFNVCMTAAAVRGGDIALATCDGREAQRFEHLQTGEIVLQAARELCVSAGAEPGRRGGGGSPPHLIRSLTLERCDAERASLQRWRVRSRAD